VEVERKSWLIVFTIPKIAPGIVDVNSTEDLRKQNTKLQYADDQRGLELESEVSNKIPKLGLTLAFFLKLLRFSKQNSTANTRSASAKRIQMPM
jgi:hypothetical protein